jgi:cell division protein FtsQ
MAAAKERLQYVGVLTALIMCALFLAAHLVWIFLADARRFPVNTVQIEATWQHITHHQMEEILERYNGYSFFSLPVSRLLAELTALDWTDRVQIERSWPDVLKIRIVEKIPAFLWNNAMLTATGEIFNEGGALKDSDLPQLKGALNRISDILQVYQKMSKILTIHGLHVAGLELRGNEAWELRLANGLLLRLGKQDPAMKVERFCKAYPALFREKTEQMASVDLRYPRGMAVQWKK